MIGDSIAGNIHLPSIESATKADVKIIKAYSAIFENDESEAYHSPKFPANNFTDVIAKEVQKHKPEALVVQAGSVDITNLKTKTEESKKYEEYFKQKTIVSAHNIFQAVTNAILEHPELKQIILMKQIPRYDCDMKQKLSKLFNVTLEQLFEGCPYKSKITLGNHGLECSGGVFEARYENSQRKKYDGIHLFGPSGMKAYTNSVLSILTSAQLVLSVPPKYYDQFKHMKCP